MHRAEIRGTRAHVQQIGEVREQRAERNFIYTYTMTTIK
jgi:hypothetical protein